MADTEQVHFHDLQRRSLRVLISSQVLGGVGVASGIAVGGLLAEQVSGSTSLAGLAQTGTVLGAALLAVPLARVADRAGRRGALALGYGLGLAGAALAVAAAVLGWFPLLLLATVLFGGATASNLQARYAATDAAATEVRGRALSVVVWATTIGAVAGPNLSGVGGRLGTAVGVPALAGPYLLSIVSFLTAALTVGLLLRPDPLLASRAEAAGGPAPGSAGPGGTPDPGAAAGHGPVSAERAQRASTLQSLRLVAARPDASLGLAAVAVGHAVMVAVMSMTPVHLGHHGASLTVVGVVISVHIVGMYGLSPLMGWVSDRFGALAMISVGLGLLAASVVLAAAAASSHLVIGVALFLLGLGWSGTLVGGSAMLSTSVPRSVRTEVQGVSDLGMGLAGTLGGALAGPVLAFAGYQGLALAAGLLLVPVAAMAVASGWERR